MTKTPLSAYIDELEAEVKRLNQALDMVAEEREAWKARALGWWQKACLHAGTQAIAFQIEDDCDADD